MTVFYYICVVIHLCAITFPCQMENDADCFSPEKQHELWSGFSSVNPGLPSALPAGWAVKQLWPYSSTATAAL